LYKSILYITIFTIFAKLQKSYIFGIFPNAARCAKILALGVAGLGVSRGWVNGVGE
jgi:hypothetical protein